MMININSLKKSKTDREFKELGYEIYTQTDVQVVYQKLEHDKNEIFLHYIVITISKDGSYIDSGQANRNSDGYHNLISLTETEARLALKKIKELKKGHKKHIKDWPDKPKVVVHIKS